MDWSTRRKFIYILAVIVTVSAVTVYSLRNVLFPTPTCFDGKKNGYEIGVDCGGICSLKCSSEVNPINVVWSQALETSPNVYDFVALISNKNIDNTSYQLGYTFIAYDENGNEIATVIGATLVPVNTDFPIIKQNIPLDKKPKEVIVKLSDGSHFVVAEKPTSPTISTVNTKYEAGDTPRIYSTVVNNKLLAIYNLPIRVVVYDINNNAFAAGETIIDYLDKEDTRDISFTWHKSFVKVPSKIIIYPIFDAFLPTQ